MDLSKKFDTLLQYGKATPRPHSMNSSQLDNRSQALEERVETLEAELTQMKQLLIKVIQEKKPWWEKIAGSFSSDPTFDDAVRFGQEWRNSAD